MPLAFGLTVVPDPPYQRLIEVRALGEQHGFEYGWTHDSRGADKGRPQLAALDETEQSGSGAADGEPG